VYNAGRFRFQPEFRESASVGAKNVLCLTVQVRIVVAGSGRSVQTSGFRRFAGMISSFLFRFSESESEPESACTTRLPLDRTATGTGYPNLSSTKSIIISHSRRSIKRAGFCANSQEVAGHILAPETGFSHWLLSSFPSVSAHNGTIPWLCHERNLPNIFKFIFSESLYNSSLHIVYNRDSATKSNTRGPAKWEGVIT